MSASLAELLRSLEIEGDTAAPQSVSFFVSGGVRDPFLEAGCL